MFHVKHGASDTHGGRAERNGGTANHGTEGGADTERRAGTARKRRRRAGAARAGVVVGACAASARSRATCAVTARSGVSAPPAVEWFAVPQWSGARPPWVSASITHVN